MALPGKTLWELPEPIQGVQVWGLAIALNRFTVVKGNKKIRNQKNPCNFAAIYCPLPLLHYTVASIVPRLLPSSLSHTVQKNGESLGMRLWTLYTRGIKAEAKPGIYPGNGSFPENRMHFYTVHVHASCMQSASSFRH